MKKTLGKAAIGIILVAAIVATQLCFTAPVSATTPELKLTQTFENATGIGAAWETGIIGAEWATVTGQDGVAPLSIAENVAGHTKSLRVHKTSKSASFGPRIAIGNDTGTGLGNVTDGTAYNVIISLDYKIDQVGNTSWGPMIQQFYFGRDAISASLSGVANRSVYISNNTDANTAGNYAGYKAIMDSTWHTMSFAATIHAKQDVTNGNTRFGFSFDIAQATTCDFYLDNISVQIVDAGATYSLNSKNGVAMDVVAGIVGEPANLPVPEKEGADFGGWYTDDACTVPFGSTYTANTTSWTNSATSTTLENAITQLYAKWSIPYEEMTQNFDAADSIGGEWGSQVVISNNATYLSLATEEGRGKVLRINKSSSSGAYDTRIRIARDAGAPSLGSITAGTDYDLIVTFDYKVEDATGAEWGPYIKSTYLWYTPTYNASYLNGVRNKYYVAFDNTATAETPEYHFSSHRAVCDGEWHTISFKASANAIESAANGAFVFNLTVNNGDKLVANFDNFRIKKLASGIETSTVILNSNGGTAYSATTGIVGNPIDLPVPVMNNATFGGWYRDADFTVPAGDTFITDTDVWNGGGEYATTNGGHVTNYYAKWILDDGYKTLTETFQNVDTADLSYRFSEDISAMHGTVSIENDGGNKYFKYTYNSNSNNFSSRFAVFDENDTNWDGLSQDIRAGSTYRVLISYKYKVDRAYGDGIWVSPMFLDTDSFTSVSSFVSGKAIKLGQDNYNYDANRAITINDGTWRTASVVAVLRANSTIFAGFGFHMDAAKNNLTVCLDDISVTVLEPGVIYSNVSVDASGTECKLDNVAGLSGTDITANIPTSMYIKAAKFNGFKDQNDNYFTIGRKFENYDLTFTADIERNKKVYDYNFDNVINLKDMLRLKKNVSQETDYKDYAGDIKSKFVELRKKLFMGTTVQVGGTEYTLAWADEFDESSLDESVWRKLNQENEYEYDSSNHRVNIKRNSTSLVAIENGKLKLGYSRNNTGTYVNVYRDGSDNYYYNPDDTTGLTLVQANAPVWNASSGAVVGDKMFYKYGYIEARIKLPGNKFGAEFWLNNNSATVLHNEVDMFETMYTNDAKSNIHTWDPDNSSAGGSAYHRDWHATYSSVVDDSRKAVTSYNSDQYYTFGFEWNQDVVKFYIDGTNYLTVRRSDIGDDFDGFINSALNINLSSTLYKNNTGESSKSVLVDYVRVYQTADAANEIYYK